MPTSFTTLHGPYDLASLIEHAGIVDASESVEAVDRLFDHHNHEYMAVAAGSRVVGLCSRTHVHGLRDNRWRPLKHRQAPICRHILPECLSVRADQTLHDLLQSALSRQGEAFYHDVVLVDGDFRLVGLVPTRRIVQAQSALMKHQARLLTGQRPDGEGARLEAVRTPEPHRAPEIIATVVTARAREAGLSLTLQLPDTETEISADASQIQRILVDLVTNAVDFMASVRDRRVTIQVETTGASAQRSGEDARSGGVEDHLLGRRPTHETAVTTYETALGRTA